VHWESLPSDLTDLISASPLGGDEPWIYRELSGGWYMYREEW